MSGVFNRVIPCLLLQDGGLVKTERFKKPKYVGDPINAIRIFNDKYVDELIFLDINASRLNKEPDYDLIARIAGECFMPLCYGGGIKTLEQARKLVAIGVEKISINSMAIYDLELIKQLVSELGSQSVVGAIDIKRNFWGKEYVYDASKSRLTNLNPQIHAQNLVDAGVGEIFINDVSRDGTFSGYNTALVSSIADKINVPLIVCGGASSIGDMQDVFMAGASAAAAGSLFVFYGPHRAVLINYPDYSIVKKLFSSNAA
ncbi:AglZ/HisF2 family acetamidino modification protein [Methylotenera sp.]|uniref:AglZ/HisF2 family acetamidino modification protein n=1 Tax=Methylotenera sp. TaxID=2051956 RepID=UPI0027366C8F|nr:AglZ/HisF2 family acetamidino modification protein [Methylotenera sp.]MDP3776384.1 AglZ/HisF2 family acetamidino modification protein [Methylotenera sp.]